MEFCTHACMCMCMSPPPRLLIISYVMWAGMIWNSYDWLKKFYSLYMAAIVGIVSRHGLLIKACHRNQPNKSNHKLALYKLLLYCNIYLKQLYISNKIECFSYKGGCGICGCGICGCICIKAFKSRLAGPPRGGTTGAIFPGRILLGAPYSPMSLLSCKNVFNYK